MSPNICARCYVTVISGSACESPSKGGSLSFRLYGPKRAFFDQTWKLNDIEKVK